MEDSTEIQMIRPESVMEELGIKKSKYYEILNQLNLKAFKDSNGRSYLTIAQVEKVKNYLSNHQSLLEDSVNDDDNQLVKVDENNLSSEDIYEQPLNPLSSLDVNRLLRTAAELKARELATPDLVIRAIADRMNEDDLPEDLKEKVSAVRESTSPKWTPAGLADSILLQYRSSRNVSS